MRVCSEPGCPTLTNTRRCSQHARAYEHARGTRHTRGYGTAHDRERARWKPAVDAGAIICWRCGNPIIPGTPWDLGHVDGQAAYAGPEHMNCNRSAAGRKAHQNDT